MEKVIDLEERIPSFRERRKRRKNLKFILLTTIFIVILLFLLYLQSSYSKVQKIAVQGNVLEQQQFYIDESKLVIGQSMWSFTAKDIEQKFEQLEWIKKIEVKRDLLTAVTIEIEEYKKVAYLSEGNVYYPMLENGYIYKNGSANLPIDAPVFIDFEDESLRKRLLKELPQIDASILALISQINAVPTESDPYAIILYMNDGYEIRAEIPSLAEKINYYPSIIAQIESEERPEKGIIDIEVGTYYQSYEKEYGFEMSEEELEEESVESDQLEDVPQAPLDIEEQEQQTSSEGA